MDAILETGTPVVMVLACGSSLRVEEGNVILWTGYPGQAGGAALARILFVGAGQSGRRSVQLTGQKPLELGLLLEE